MSLIFIDIDRFKLINDTHGHLVGDAVIKDLTSRIGLMIRKGDTFARQGGEEFSLILPDTSIDGAVILAQRVCARINSVPFVFSDVSVPYTVSIGLTIYSGKNPKNKNALIAAADEALGERRAVPGHDRRDPGGRARRRVSDTLGRSAPQTGARR